MHTGFRFLHKEFCIISEFPIKFEVDENNQGHCENGPYVEWADGSAIYSYHGVRVPGWILENPEKISRDDILNEENAEVRRVMIEKIGWEKYLDLFGAETINTDDWGELLRAEIDGNEQWLVKAVNSTAEPNGEFKTYILMVDDPMKHYGVRTARAALASMIRYEDTGELALETPEEYKPLVET